MEIRRDSCSGSRPRVLQVVGNAIVGGVESWVSRLLPTLRQRGFHVTCVFPFESSLTDRLRGDGWPIHITAMPEDVAWDSVQFVATLVRELGIQVMHAHLGNAHALASLAGAVTAVPTLATLHGRSIALQDLEAYCLGHSEVTVVCEDARLQALRFGMSPAHVHLIPNGIDCAEFDATADGFDLRAQLGLAPDIRLVGFVGRLDTEKNPLMFVQMAERLRYRHPDVVFVLIGEGPLRAPLQERVQAMGAAETIVFAGNQTSMRDVYAALEVLVLTSLTEGMPFALMEAMASGVPAVATHVGGVPTILRAGSSGVLVHAGDVEYAGEAVSGLLDDPARRHAMGARARHTIATNLPWARTAADIAGCLQRLAGDGAITPVATARREIAAPACWIRQTENLVDQS